MGEVIRDLFIDCLYWWTNLGGKMFLFGKDCFVKLVKNILTHKYKKKIIKMKVYDMNQKINNKKKQKTKTKTNPSKKFFFS